MTELTGKKYDLWISWATRLGYSDCRVQDTAIHGRIRNVLAPRSIPIFKPPRPLWLQASYVGSPVAPGLSDRLAIHLIIRIVCLMLEIVNVPRPSGTRLR